MIEALSSGHLDQVTHELCDLLYVTFGTINAIGLQFHLSSALVEVHLANMRKVFPSKLQAEKALTIRPMLNEQKLSVRGTSNGTWVLTNGSGKVVKPPNHVNPDVQTVLLVSKSRLVTQAPNIRYLKYILVTPESTNLYAKVTQGLSPITEGECQTCGEEITQELEGVLCGM